MRNNTQPTHIIVLLFGAVGAFSAAKFVTLHEALTLLFYGVSIGLGVMLVFSIGLYYWSQSIRLVDRTADAIMAKQTIAASNLRGQPRDAREYLEKMMLIEWEGIMGPPVIWNLVLSNGRRIDREFVTVFLDLCEERNDGFLVPVREHHNIRFQPFASVEENISMITNEFYLHGWVDDARGNQSAKLRDGMSIEWIREMLEL